MTSSTASSRPLTARGRARREQILASAAALMAERGYPAVSLADIGADAGIVSSAIYRHFSSKGEILGELMVRVVERMDAGLRDVAGSGGEGIDLLDALVRRQAEIAMENRHLVAVYLRDSGNLDPERLRSLRRLQRSLVGEWINQAEAATVLPLTETELRTVVQGVLALINSAATYDNPLPVGQLVDQLARMGSAAMREGLGLSVQRTE